MTDTCVIIGASHAGVNCAFALRKEGWKGSIILLDSDSYLPYHRPPLSKTFLTKEEPIEKYQLKSRAAYDEAQIELKLGVKIQSIDRAQKHVTTDSGVHIAYTKLVIATGAKARIPNIHNLENCLNIYTLRNAQDVIDIKNKLNRPKNVVVVGGGYIGLEIAASLTSLSCEVDILERDNEILSRVSSPELAKYLSDYHKSKGVRIHTSTEAKSLKEKNNHLELMCNHGHTYLADFGILGVGIHLNLELAQNAGLDTKTGIVVNSYCQTSDKDIYAIGDCTQHYSIHYQRKIRLESVQNAVEQAKSAAKAICTKAVDYDIVPWFWSDQYDLKLQMVGLIETYNELVIRINPKNPDKRSYWYFNNKTLLAVQAVNDAKAYVIGTKAIKNRTIIDKNLLTKPGMELKSLLV